MTLILGLKPYIRVNNSKINAMLSEYFFFSLCIFKAINLAHLMTCTGESVTSFEELMAIGCERNHPILTFIVLICLLFGQHSGLLLNYPFTCDSLEKTTINI